MAEESLTLSPPEMSQEPTLQHRKKPNILVTGTPGTGKTTMCELLVISTNLEHIDVSKLVKEKKLHDGYDEEYDTFILNDDKVIFVLMIDNLKQPFMLGIYCQLCDELENIMQDGGKIVDFHSCDIFPERWFDLVVVLRSNNTILYDRLKAR